MLLRQIIGCSNYSSSVKNYGDYVCQFREKSFERNLLRRRIRKKKKSLVRPFPAGKPRGALKLLEEYH